MHAHNLNHWFIGFVMVAVIALLPVGEAAASLSLDDGGGLFESAGRAAPAAAADSGTFVKRSRGVSLRLNQLPDPRTQGIPAAPQQTLTLNLFDDAVYTAGLDRVERMPGGQAAWIGHLQGREYGPVTLIISPDGIVTGNISLEGAAYQVRYSEAGGQVVRQVDYTVLPREADPKKPAPTADSFPAAGSPQADSAGQIDVMVVYTPSARAAVGGSSAMQSLINLAVSETNQAYSNSGIAQRIRLVHAAEVSYTESGSFNTDLDRLTDADGWIDEVLTWRNTYGADLVSMWINSNEYCGLGWMMDEVGSWFAPYGFTTVAYDCATGYYSFAHEMGHNMGARHDWYQDLIDSPTNPPALSQPYEYAHGYYYGTSWRTIMAYAGGCSNCTRLPYFSNPDVTYGGVPMGIPEGSYHPADNRKTLNNTASTVANFRQAISDCQVFSTATNGPGTVTVELLSGSPCSSGYNSGAVVRLSAVPNFGYIFTGWSGGASGSTNPLSVNVTGPLSITASFGPPAASLDSPSGKLYNGLVTYRWNRVDTATDYALLVNNATGTVVSSVTTAVGASCGSGEPVCSTARSEILSAGSYTWWIRTRTGEYNGPWSNSLSFNIGVPSKPVLQSPSGTVQLDVAMQPSYKWSPADGATRYLLWITGPNGVVQNTVWYPSDICSGATCTVSAATVPNPSPQLVEGGHNWWVLAANTVGNSAWSDGLTFTAVPPAPGRSTLLSPLDGTATTTTPLFTFTSVPAVNWYYLDVKTATGTQKIGQWFQGTQICGPTSCLASATTRLDAGPHVWKVWTWNTFNGGTYNETATTTFTAVRGWDEAPMLITPSGNTLLGSSMRTDYVWHKISGAEEYRLYINNSAGNIFNQVLSATQTGCIGLETLTCMAPASLTLVLSEGSHTWWVQPRKNSGLTLGLWSNGMAFTAKPPAPAAPTGLAPSGGLMTTTPDFSWTPVVVASWYRLEVRQGSATGTVVHNQWYTRDQAGCGTGTCRVVKPKLLGPGLHNWRVTAWNSSGMDDSAWANLTAVQQWGETPTLISPSGNTVLGSSMQADYVWHKISGAEEYRLYINNSAGNIFNQVLSATQTGCIGLETLTCTAPASLTLVLSEGSHTWWVQPRKNSGLTLGLWSNGMAFTAKPPAPAAPTGLAPSGGLMTTTPDFSWTPVVVASWYRLEVRQGSATGTVVHNQWYTRDQAGCGTGTCRVVKPKLLGPGLHNWRVTAWNSSGMDDSAWATFTAVQQWGETPTLISPSGNTVLGSSMQADYVWHKINGAENYRLFINGPSGTIFNQVFSTAEAGCSVALTCTVSAATVPNPSPQLVEGSHTWWILPANAVGNSVWSDGMAFTAVPPPPGRSTLLSPPGGTATTTTPLFTFTSVPAVNWYYLDVKTATGTNRIGQWFQGTQICGSTTCTASATTRLDAGPHAWNILTWNTSNGGTSNKSATATFTAVRGWDEAPMLITPSGNTVLGSSMQADYVWHKINGAEEYRLYINNSAGNIYNEVLSATQTGCIGTEALTCTAVGTLTRALEEGSHTWWVQPRKNNGQTLGLWSSGLVFNAKPPAPAAPTGLIPDGVLTTTTPDFSWNRVSGASWYLLEVRQGYATGTVVHTQWYTKDQAGCSASICTVVKPKQLGPGMHYWRVKSWNVSGSADSAQVNFTTHLTWPEVPVLISPAGNYRLPDLTWRATYTWHSIESADKYEFWIGSQAGKLLSAEYTPAQAGCSSGLTCTLPLALPVLSENVSYTWYIRAFKGVATGAWSAGLPFTALRALP